MTRLFKIALGLLPALAASACYTTSSVESGGLLCSTAGTCPDGFACGTDGRCWKNGTGSTANTCSVADAVAPYGPFAGCSASQPTGTSSCDPVCQNGCPCDQRCIFSSSDSGFVCEGSTPSGSFISHLGACNGADVGQCAPGAVCIADQGCPNLCYQTCRANGDCPSNSRCSKNVVYAGDQALSGAYLCSPPVETCDPSGAAACSSPADGFNCVFVAGLTGVGNTDATVCDCAAGHTEAVGADCSVAPDNCQPGSVCMSGKCHTICSRSASAAACSNGGTCNTLYSSSRYGYCSK